MRAGAGADAGMARHVFFLFFLHIGSGSTECMYIICKDLYTISNGTCQINVLSREGKLFSFFSLFHNSELVSVLMGC